MGDRPIRQQHVLLEDVIDGLAVIHGSRAGGIVRHHPANGRAAGGGDIRREPKSVRAKHRIELVKHDPGFDSCPALLDVHLEDAVEILRRVDDDARADGLSRLRRPASAHRDRTLERRAYPHRLDHVVTRPRYDDTERLDLVDAGVGGIEHACDAVEAHFALELALELGPEGVGVHRLARPSRSRSSPFVSVSPPLANETRSVPSPPSPYADPCATTTP